MDRRLIYISSWAMQRWIRSVSSLKDRRADRLGDDAESDPIDMRREWEGMNHASKSETQQTDTTPLRDDLRWLSHQPAVGHDLGVEHIEQVQEDLGALHDDLIIAVSSVEARRAVG